MGFDPDNPEAFDDPTDTYSPDKKFFGDFAPPQAGWTNNWGSIGICGRACTFFAFSGNSSSFGTTIDQRIADTQRSNYSIAGSRSRPTRCRVHNKVKINKTLFNIHNQPPAPDPPNPDRIKKIWANADCPQKNMFPNLEESHTNCPHS